MTAHETIGSRGKDALPAGITQRMLSKEQLAAYCNISLGHVNNWISAGYLPRAMKNTRLWDIRAVDAALDKNSDIKRNPTNDLDNEFNEWEKQHGGFGED